MFDFRVEFPRLKTPIALIIDDPAPYVNHLYYLKKYLNPKYPDYYEEFKTIPNDFLEDFISVVKKWPVKGKFSVIPNPAGQGYLDEGLRGYPKEGVERWVRLVKDEVAPLFDITPEMITHTNAVDLKTGELLPMHEQTWASQQTAETLTPYIAKALETLKKLGFETNGVTSPGAFGIDVEAEYARAVLNAVKRVYGAGLAWYFLKVDKRSYVVYPRLAYLDKYRGEAVVSIVSGNDDVIWSTMTPESRRSWSRRRLLEYADYYITGDGKAGRLVELLNAGSYVVFHTHWNSLWSNDARHGLAVMEEVLKRINTLIGDRVLWMKLSEIACYYAASKTLDIHVDKSPDHLRLFVDNRFPCPDLTVSFNCGFKVDEVYLEKGSFRSGWTEAKTSETVMKLEKSVDELRPNTWVQKGERLIICFDNRLGNTVEVKAA
ncbi:MAG: hypothetical protein AYL29_007110 [Candidatus Bathyarchaeota archaeon B24]|nr:MAG: hypothetical protein AYL29_007110 [Candidatus Bathyarchaeota archaeon B24]